MSINLKGIGIGEEGRGRILNTFTPQHILINNNTHSSIIKDKNYPVGKNYVSSKVKTKSSLFNKIKDNHTYPDKNKLSNYRDLINQFSNIKKNYIRKKYLIISINYFGIKNITDSSYEILQCILDWTNDDIFWNNFYKYISLCESSNEDSFCANLNMSRVTFWRHFKIIGKAYHTIDAYLRYAEKNEDPFDGKILLSYHNPSDHSTHYVVNVPLMIKILENALYNVNNEFGRKNHGNPHECFHVSQRNIVIKKNTISKNTISLRKITSPTSPKNPPTIQQEVRDVSPEVEEMIKIWEKEISPIEKSLTPARRLRLKAAYENYFGSSLERWRSYCIRIANNGFLMGNGPNRWKADIFWATGSENIEKVLANTYSGQKEVFEIPIKSEVRIEDIPSLQGDGIAVNALRAIASGVGLTDYNTWMGNIGIEDLHKPIVRIIAPSRFHADRIETNFRRGIREALRSVLPNFKDVDIVSEGRTR